MKQLVVRVMLICIASFAPVYADPLGAGLGADRSALSSEQIAARSRRFEESTTFSLLRYPEALRAPARILSPGTWGFIDAAARAHSLDPMVLAGMIFVESYGDPLAKSPTGPAGIAQLTKSVGKRSSGCRPGARCGSARRPSRRRGGWGKVRAAARSFRRCNSPSTKPSTSDTFLNARSKRWRAASAAGVRGSAARRNSRLPNTTWAPAAWPGSSRPTSAAPSGYRMCLPRWLAQPCRIRSSTGPTRRISGPPSIRRSKISRESTIRPPTTSASGRPCDCSRCIANHRPNTRASPRDFRTGSDTRFCRAGNGASWTPRPSRPGTLGRPIRSPPADRDGLRPAGAHQRHVG